MIFWQVILCTGGQERRVFDNLLTSDYPVFWPRWEVCRVHRGIKRCTERPFATGYIFTQFDISDPYIWHEIKNICGKAFHNFIGGPEPISIPDYSFDNLRKDYNATDDGLMKAPADQTDSGEFKKGTTVRIMGAGPFESYTGTVLWSDVNGVQLSVRVFGRETRVFIPQGTVELERIRTEDYRRRRVPRSQHGRDRFYYSPAHAR